MKQPHKNSFRFFCMLLSLLFRIAIPAESIASDPPVAGWHRGNVASFQENSRKAIVKALDSEVPNIEVDIIDFINEDGKRVGLLTHDYMMKRITGAKGKFGEHNSLPELGLNRANPNLPPESFMSVLSLFELLREKKDAGTIPTVSLDMKEEGRQGKEFGRWVGRLIKEFGFEKHVFASSFYPSNVKGVKEECPDCMVGGLVFNDHWALKLLNPHYSSLDLSPMSKATFLFGYLFKKEFSHDFVLIQDDILFQQPELAAYWRNTRHVKFVGVFTYEKFRPYSEQEWQILQTADWLEIDPVQMNQYMENYKIIPENQKQLSIQPKTATK